MCTQKNKENGLDPLKHKSKAHCQAQHKGKVEKEIASKHHRSDEHFLLIDKPHQRSVNAEVEQPSPPRYKPSQDEHNVMMLATKIRKNRMKMCNR